MTSQGGSRESFLIVNLKNDDKAAFTLIFTRFYKDLVHFSYTFTRNADLSEEIVQEVFLKLWENRSTLHIHTSLKSYLLKIVQNKSIDSIRHQDIKHNYASLLLSHPVLAENDTENYILHSDLESAFKRAMSNLPVQYAEAYKMNRTDLLSYSEIATILNVSVRTVEVRIGKALFLLHKELRDYLLVLLLSLPLIKVLSLLL